jgi:proteasome lid subunit RPN8/RPN11
MAPAEQIEAFSRMEAEGLDLLGIFHSHPAPPEAAALDHPSPSDIAESAYPVANIIWVRTNDGWQAHGYDIHAGGLTPVLLAVEDGEKRKES